MEIIAHRGASFDAPENTLSSFKLGFQQKADANECDIYLTRDGKIVVLHDPDTYRTAGVSNKVAQTDLANLQKLEYGQWGKFQGSKYSDKIPLLEEVLPLVPEGKRLFIEIKCGPEVLPELQRVLKASGKKPVQTPIIGFGYETVRDAKALMPELEISWLVSPKRGQKPPPIEELIDQAKAARLDGLDLNYGFPIDKGFVDKVHAAGLKLYTWTVDDAEVARGHKKAGVDGITTNRPQWLREQLAQ